VYCAVQNANGDPRELGMVLRQIHVIGGEIERNGSRVPGFAGGFSKLYNAMRRL
jgi:hypothetical protein